MGIQHSRVEFVTNGNGDALAYKRHDGSTVGVVTAKTDPVTGGSGLFAGDRKVVDTISTRTALEALSLAATRRVDIVMIGDSNQNFGAGGGGFNHGLEKQVSERFPVYATGQVWGKSSVITAWSSATLNGTNMLGVSDTSDALAAPFRMVGGTCQSGEVLAAVSHSSNTGGLSVRNVANGLPIKQTLRAWYAFAVSEDWANGLFRPGVRWGATPFHSVGIAPASISTTAGVRNSGLRIVSVDTSADPERTASLETRWQLPGASVTGPAVMYYVRAEDVTRTAGVSFHTLSGEGGAGAWNMATNIQNTSDEMLSMYFAETRRLQLTAGQNPVVVVYINTGLNDRNSSFTPSRGPARVAATGDTSPEYVDNIRAIQRRIKQIFRLNEWPESELYWLIVPSHRISDPDDAKLISYRAATTAALEPEGQTSVVDLGALMTAAEATAGSWYDGGGAIHLTAAGYEAVSQLIVDQIP